MKSINQIQVDKKSDLTFANGLKSILRQDPDIIMLGEIRDEETASLAINAALTGHLVLSTLHTNDAATTVPRLQEMKVSPYFIATAVNLIIAQRLVRQLCVKCRHSYQKSPEELQQIKEHPDLQEWVKDNLYTPKSFFKAKGCSVCHHKGFIGRSGVFEVMEINESMRKIILSGANADEIRKTAVQQGMKTIIEDGMDKVMAGITTTEELFRTISI